MKGFLIMAAITASFLAGVYLGSSEPQQSYTQDVKPPETSILKQPSTPQEYVYAFNSPIVIYRKLEDSLLTITATDGYKQSAVYDRIEYRRKNHLIIGGVGVDSSLRPTYSCGYLRNVWLDGLYVGGVASFSSSSFSSLSVLAAFQF